MLDANEAALNKYMEQIEQEEREYEELLETLRAEEDPDNWDEIIDNSNWCDADRLEILGDI